MVLRQNGRPKPPERATCHSPELRFPHTSRKIESSAFSKYSTSPASIGCTSSLATLVDVLPQPSDHYEIIREHTKPSMSSYGQDSFTLSLLVQSGQHLSTHANAAFCTVLVWSNSSSGGPSQLTTPPKYTSFRSVNANSSVEWNEQVQVPVTNPATEVLTVRVKDSSDSLVGSCNIYLAHLRPEEALNQWFQLHPAGHIHLKVVLNANQRFVPNPNSPYSADFQMLLDLEMKKRAATVNESPLPSHIAALLEARNKEQQQTQPHYPTGFPTTFPVQPQQASGSNNFHEMIGTAANISTIAANLQQLNGNTAGVDTSGLGTVASVALGAVGLGPLGLFFGSS